MVEMRPVCIHTRQELDLAGCVLDDTVGKKGTFAVADGTLYEVWRGDRDRAWAVRLPRVMTPTGLLAQAVRLRHQRPLVAGIYMLYCEVSGRAYIGSSATVYQRLSTHMADLNGKRHSSAHMQHAWRIHGKDKFAFLLIERMAQDTTEEALVDRESYYMLGCGKQWLYNSTVPAIIGGAKGRKLSEQARKNISLGHMGHTSNRGIRQSVEARQAQSKRQQGKPLHPNFVRAAAAVVTGNGLLMKGERNGRAKLTEQDVREILALLAKGQLSQTEIGNLFGVDQAAISRIKLGTGWKHLPR